MSVDLSKIKPGDEVTVRGVVDSVRDFVGGAELLVKFEDWRRQPDVRESWSYVGVNVDQLASHTPKALSVGDRVRGGGWRCTFTVVALDDGWAWLKDAEGSRVQEPISVLERIND